MGFFGNIPRAPIIQIDPDTIRITDLLDTDLSHYFDITIDDANNYVLFNPKIGDLRIQDPDDVGNTDYLQITSDPTLGGILQNSSRITDGNIWEVKATGTIDGTTATVDIDYLHLDLDALVLNDAAANALTIQGVVVDFNGATLTAIGLSTLYGISIDLDADLSGFSAVAGVHCTGDGQIIDICNSDIGISLSGTFSEEVILIGGTYDHGIRFSEDPVAGDEDNSFINIGQYGSPIAVAPDGANMFGEMHNVTLTDVDVAFWYQSKYTKITTAGTTTSTSIAADAIRVNVGSDLEAVYGIQCHTNITATNACNQEIISVSTMVDLAAATVTTTDRVCALQAMFSGAGVAGTVTGDAIVAYLVNAGTILTTDDILRVYNQAACTTVNMVNIKNDGITSAGILIDIGNGRSPSIDANIRGTISGRIEQGAYYYEDDFDNRAAKPEWTARVSTGGTGGVPTAGDLNGVNEIITAGVITNEESLDWNDIFTFQNTLRPTFEVRVYLEDVGNDSNYAFGLVNTNIGNGQAGLALNQGGAANQDFVIIELSHTTHGDALWHLSCQLDGVSTVDDGAAAVATTWTVLRFEFVSDTEVEWFIDNVSQGTIDTNVPTDPLQPLLFVLTDAGATRYVDVDYVKIWQDRA